MKRNTCTRSQEKQDRRKNTSTATPGEKSEAVKHSILTAQKESIDYFWEQNYYYH